MTNKTKSIQRQIIEILLWTFSFFSLAILSLLFSILGIISLVNANFYGFIYVLLALFTFCFSFFILFNQRLREKWKFLNIYHNKQKNFKIPEIEESADTITFIDSIIDVSFLNIRRKTIIREKFIAKIEDYRSHYYSGNFLHYLKRDLINVISWYETEELLKLNQYNNSNDSSENEVIE